MPEAKIIPISAPDHSLEHSIEQIENEKRLLEELINYFMGLSAAYASTANDLAARFEQLNLIQNNGKKSIKSSNGGAINATGPGPDEQAG